jgi:hypothetical protein
MRRTIFVGVFAAGVIGFELALSRLFEVGTCASGGPYVIANECPDGTTGWTFLLFGSILATVIGGIGWPVLGEGKRRGLKGPWLPLFIWVPGTRECALFAPLTAAVLLLTSPETATLIGAGALLLLGPGVWLVGHLLLRAADSRPRGRRS